MERGSVEGRWAMLDRLGATPTAKGHTRFSVWAPTAKSVALVLERGQPGLLALTRDEEGVFSGEADVGPGTLYRFRLDGSLVRPDPASRWQPKGVHGPSAVVDLAFPWTDVGWRGLRLDDYVLYELHVGTYTHEGTFDAVVPHLDGLKDLGITAIEIMPVAQFPGTRNWGYDGVYPFAAQDSYGGPDGLRRLVDAAHAQGLAVVLDVVYNHIGPEGNYLADFAPYFTDRYLTPWGRAINFDGPDSDSVRRYFIENALYWVSDCHIDALRLDAVHAILDHSPRLFLRDLAVAVKARARQLDRRIHLIAETSANDSRLVRRPARGGVGLDAHWTDDFHHVLHVLLTGEQDGYYVDYGGLAQIEKVLAHGYAYTGEYSRFRRRRHGTPTTDLSGRRFVIATQNHDQVGNRMLGERLSSLVDHESLKLAAGLMLLSPYLPLVFMGEEYGESAPFLYFVSHSDPALVDAVRRGRREEFSTFVSRGEAPDPQDEHTFLRSRLDHDLAQSSRNASLRAYYRELLHLRRSHVALRGHSLRRQTLQRSDARETLLLRRWRGGAELVVHFHLGKAEREVTLELPPGRWRKRLDSADVRWDGPGSTVSDDIQGATLMTLCLPPHSLQVFERRLPEQP
jgi:maltooligosyltrehalose trehalohydrolase